MSQGAPQGSYVKNILSEVVFKLAPTEVDHIAHFTEVKNIPLSVTPSTTWPF